ncbi:unnamed protein product, partial [Ectocarpus fasciculatus]
PGGLSGPLADPIKQEAAARGATLREGNGGDPDTLMGNTVMGPWHCWCLRWTRRCSCSSRARSTTSSTTTCRRTTAASTTTCASSTPRRARCRKRVAPNVHVGRTRSA